MAKKADASIQVNHLAYQNHSLAEIFKEFGKQILEMSINKENLNLVLFISRK